MKSRIHHLFPPHTPSPYTAPLPAQPALDLCCARRPGRQPGVSRCPVMTRKKASERRLPLGSGVRGGAGCTHSTQEACAPSLGRPAPPSQVPGGHRGPERPQALPQSRSTATGPPLTCGASPTSAGASFVILGCCLDLTGQDQTWDGNFCRRRGPVGSPRSKVSCTAQHRDP